MEFKSIKIEKPEDANIILGQSHFIKTVEDLYEALVNTVPNIKFGVAFCEASGLCLVRYDGNDAEMIEVAKSNAKAIAAGHSFIIAMRGAYPLNVLNTVKNVYEVCNIFCATSNDVEVIIAENNTGRGIMGVIDGCKPKGSETQKDISERKNFLRKIGYKR